MVKNRFVQWMVCLTLVACFSACSKKEYANMIPRDAALVVSADPEALIRGVGGTEELKKLASRTENALLKSVLSSPEETGVDVTEKVYLFASLNRDEPTLLMKLGKASALEQWLEKMNENGLCEKMQRRGDFTWAFFSGQGYCAFTGEVVIWVYAPLLPPETVLNRLSQLIKQKPEDSFLSTGQYKRLMEIKDNVAFFLSLSTLPNSAELSTILGLPSSLSAEDLRMMGGITVSKEKASFSAQYYSENKDLNDFLEKQGADVHSLSKEYFKYIPEDVLVCIALKVEEDAYARISALPGVGDVLFGLVHYSGIDTEQFLNSLNGDFILGLKWAQNKGTFPQLMCYAGATGGATGKVLKEGLDQNEGLWGPALKSVTPDNYIFTMPGMGALRFGVQKESFYLLSGEGAPFSEIDKSLSKSRLKGMEGELISYLLLNVSNLGAAEEIAQEYVGDKMTFLRQIKTVEFMVRPGNRLELNVYFLSA